MVVLYLFLMVLSILVFSAVLVHILDWKYYKPVYYEVKGRRLFNVLGLVSTSDGTDDGYGSFIWFYRSGDFKLSEGVYLFNNIITYLDPYSFYWFLKYKKLMTRTDIKTIY